MGLLREPDHRSNPPTGRLIVKCADAALETKGAIPTDRPPSNQKTGFLRDAQQCRAALETGLRTAD